VAAEDLDGDRVAVTGHRDGAAFDRAVAELLEGLGVAPELVPGPPGPALQRLIESNLGLVVVVARTYRGGSVAFAD
jgi:hypothetical protein